MRLARNVVSLHTSVHSNGLGSAREEQRECPITITQYPISKVGLGSSPKQRNRGTVEQWNRQIGMC